MFNKFKKLYATLHYYPKKDFDNRKQIQIFFDSLKQNPAILKVEGFVQDQILQVKTIKENFEQLSDVMLDAFHNNFEPHHNLAPILDHNLVHKSDSIFTDEVRTLIKDGLKTMSESRDPFHDISHIRRCLKLAKFYFSIYRFTHKIDWGTLVLAIIYHDISRVNKVGMIYDNKRLKFLERIPFIVDATILKQVLSDAQKSNEVFLQKASEVSLNQNLIENISAGILGTSYNIAEYSSNIQSNLYFKILNDIDLLEMFTIGRFESALNNIKVKKMTSEKYFNRATFLVSFRKNQAKKSLKLTFSRPIFDFYIGALNKYGKKFYPKDADLLGF